MKQMLDTTYRGFCHIHRNYTLSIVRSCKITDIIVRGDMKVSYATYSYGFVHEGNEPNFNLVQD